MSTAVNQQPTGNKAVSFLKKFGLILLKGVGVAAEVGGIAVPFLGTGSNIVKTVVSDITKMSQQAVTVEAVLNGAQGADKMKALVPLVAGIVRTSETVSGKQVANEELFIKACEAYAQATVDLLNSLHPDAALPAVADLTVQQ